MYYKQQNPTFPWSIIIFMSFIYLFFIAGLAIHHEQQNLASVKSGQKTLICYINNTDKIIPPHKIVDRVDDTYIFTNGYASNCKILNTPYSTFKNLKD